MPTWFLGKARCCLGDYGGAIALLEEAYALCDRIGDRAWKSRLLNTLGWCFAEIGAPSARASTTSAPPRWRARSAIPRSSPTPTSTSPSITSRSATPARALALIEPLEAALARPGDPWMRWRYALHVRDVRGAHRAGARRARRRAGRARMRELDGARRHRVAEGRGARPRRCAARRCSSSSAATRRRRACATASRWPSASATCAAPGGRTACSPSMLRRRGAAAAAAAHDAQARAAVERAAGSLADAELRRRLIASALGEPA